MTQPDVLLVGDVESPHINRLAVGLMSIGHQVRVAGFSSIAIGDVTSIDLGWSRQPPSDIQFLLAVPRLAQAIRHLSPSIVNAHYVTSYGLMATLAMRMAFPRPPRPTLVQTAWGTDLLITANRSAIHRQIARAALRTADLITGDSSDLEVAARQYAPKTRFHRFVFGPPRDLRTAPREDRPVILSSRRLDPDTRVPLIIDAFRMAREMAPHELRGWRLVIAGRGTERTAIKAQVAGDQDIDCVGQLEREALQALLLRSSLAVSIPISDATSASVLETMAAGLIPVVNDLPANLEWVDASIGVIVPKDPTTAQLASGIVEGIVHRFDRSAVRDRVAAVTWEAELARLSNAFRSVAGGRPSKFDEARP